MMCKHHDCDLWAAQGCPLPECTNPIYNGSNMYYGEEGAKSREVADCRYTMRPRKCASCGEMPRIKKITNKTCGTIYQAFHKCRKPLRLMTTFHCETYEAAVEAWNKMIDPMCTVYICLACGTETIRPAECKASYCWKCGEKL